MKVTVNIRYNEHFQFMVPLSKFSYDLSPPPLWRTRTGRTGLVRIIFDQLNGTKPLSNGHPESATKHSIGFKIKARPGGVQPEEYRGYFEDCTPLATQRMDPRGGFETDSTFAHQTGAT